MELIPLPELPKIDMFIVNLGGSSSRVNMVESEAVPDSGSISGLHQAWRLQSLPKEPTKT